MHKTFFNLLGSYFPLLHDALPLLDKVSLSIRAHVYHVCGHDLVLLDPFLEFHIVFHHVELFTLHAEIDLPPFFLLFVHTLFVSQGR